MKLASDAGLNEKAFAEALQSPDTASLASSLGAACRYQSLHSLDKAEVFQTLDLSHWVPSMLMIPTLGLMELLLAGEYIREADICNVLAVRLRCEMAFLHG